MQQASTSTPDAIQREQLDPFHALLQGLIGKSNDALEGAGELALTNGGQPVDGYQILAPQCQRAWPRATPKASAACRQGRNGAKDALRCSASGR